MEKFENIEWQTSDAEIFWGEIAPTDHVVQIYENDHVFLSLLGEFVGSGLKADNCVVIIATTPHLAGLNSRLKNSGYDIDALVSTGSLILLDAEETLAKFMVNGWPDATRFRQTINQIIKRAKQNKRRIRAFGEMVAILWSRDLSGATVHLESLWNRFCETEAFCLLCAYPKVGFTQDAAASMNHICSAHSKMISGTRHEASKVVYKPVLRSA